MTNEEFNNQFRLRTKTFALGVLDYLENLPSTPVTRIMLYQLGKSSTSVGANFRAFCRARSKNEHFAKICIVVEEADESQYWLELFKEKYPERGNITLLLNEATEIIRITTSIKNKYYID